MRSWISMGILSLLMIGCDDQSANVERKEADAKQVAEQLLMSELSTAAPELERRVAEWISSEKGLVFVTEKSGGSFAIHAMPASTPWHVSCNAQEIELTIGNWEEGKGRNARLFTRPLSFASFSEEQCMLLTAVVARKMMATTAAARSP